MVVAMFIVTTFVTLPLSALGQKASPVAPARAQVEAVVKEAYDKFKNDTGGKNADYIPYLAQVDSKLFGIAIVTTDNQSLTMGHQLLVLDPVDLESLLAGTGDGGVWAGQSVRQDW